MRGHRMALAACALVVGTACGGGFAPADRIERTRVVAARSHAAGDATRAWLLPGEHASIEYLIVSPPMTSDPLGTSFVACARASTAGVNGVTGCAGPTFDMASAEVAASATPTLAHALDVPSDLVPGFSTYALTYLATCVGDALPMLDAATPRVTCAAGARGELYQLAVQVVPDLRLANHNPNIHDERYFLGDVAWEAPSPSVAATGCASLPASSALPTVRMSAHDSPLLIFGCSPDDREMYPAFDADLHPIMAHESIDIAHYVTLGTIASSTRIDDEDTNLTESTHWGRPSTRDLNDAQRSALPTGLLVRFWFVARDRRGGADWVERDLCLVE